MFDYYANKGLSELRIVSASTGPFPIYTTTGAAGAGPAITANTIFKIVGPEVKTKVTDAVRLVPVVPVDFSKNGEENWSNLAYINLNEGKFVRG